MLEGCFITTSENTRIFKLLEDNTSLGVFAQFLKAKGLPYSVNTWKDAFERRVIPALKEGKLTRADLIGLLRQVEEYGRQHVFLYRTTPVKSSQLCNPVYIRSELGKLGREDLMDKSVVLDRPNDLTLVDVRIEQVTDGNLLVVKAIEGRLYREFIGEERDGNKITRTYQEIDARAVNVARVHPDGLMELRVQSYNSSDYDEHVADFWSLLNPIVPQAMFEAESISPAKQYLWKYKKKLESKIRYSDSRLRNKVGTVLSAATGDAQASLYQDNGAVESLDTFLKGDAYCDKSNVFWIKADNGIPSKDIHIMLDGKINEFAVTAACNKTDYEFVLSEIRKFNS